MTDSNKIIADSPDKPAKTPTFKPSGIDLPKLEKAVTRAFLPYFGNEIKEGQSLIDALAYLFDQTKRQVELLQDLTAGVAPREELQIMAGSLAGFAEGLISQISVLEALNEGLYDQFKQIEKQRDEALATISFIQKQNKNNKKGGEK